MKRYLTVLGLLVLAAGLQTGCITSDMPFDSLDGAAMKMQKNFSNQAADCLTLMNDGGGAVTHDKAFAQEYMCRIDPSLGDPFGQCVAMETKTQSSNVWGHTGTGLTQSAYTLYYGVGSNTMGFEWFPTGVPGYANVPSMQLPGFVIRHNIIPDRDDACIKGTCKFSCESDIPYNFNVGGLPEATNRGGTYDGEPVLLAYDSADGCQFLGNLIDKNAALWPTPDTGIYSPTNPAPTNPWDPILDRKILSAWITCYSQMGEFYNIGYLPDVVINPTDCPEFQYGVPQSLSLKSGEASMRYIVNLNEETGNMQGTILAVTVRGKSHTLATPWTFPIGKSGRAFEIDGKNPGFRELRSWAMKNADLSKPFTVGGEYLPWAGHTVKGQMKILVLLRGE